MWRPWFTCGGAAWGGSCSPGCVRSGLRAGAWGCRWRTPAGPAERSWWARPRSRGRAWRTSAAAPACDERQQEELVIHQLSELLSRPFPHSPARSPAPSHIMRFFCTQTKTHTIRKYSLEENKRHNAEGGTQNAAQHKPSTVASDVSSSDVQRIFWKSLWP